MTLAATAAVLAGSATRPNRISQSEARRRARRGRRHARTPPETARRGAKPTIGEECGLVIVRAADVTPVAVDWIWEGRIARGKQTIIAGAPDVGKSQIGAYITARITKREHWS